MKKFKLIFCLLTFYLCSIAIFTYIGAKYLNINLQSPIVISFKAIDAIEYARACELNQVQGSGDKTVEEFVAVEYNNK